MAMTKKEQAAMQAAIDRADTLAALRWTQKVLPDVPPPGPKDSGAKYSAGWIFSAYSMSVEQGWSTSVSHGHGKAPEEGQYRLGSQGCRRLYSTQALALAAMRYEIELKTAKDLMEIDRRIAAEQAS